MISGRTRLLWPRRLWRPLNASCVAAGLCWARRCMPLKRNLPLIVARATVSVSPVALMPWGSCSVRSKWVPGTKSSPPLMPGCTRLRQYLQSGANPAYADVDPTTLTLSPESVGRQITPRTRVVIATHLFGRMADMVGLRALSEQNGLALVEDCAQSHGAALNGRRAGSWGDGAAFSFYPTKNLGALGDAGAVVTSDAALARRVKNLRQYGWQDKYVVLHRGGRNSRLDELQAALLRVKLGFLDRWNAQRRAVAKCYSATLKHPDILTPPVDGDDYVAHLYVVRSARRDALRNYLKQHGVSTDVHYPLLDYQQPFLKIRLSPRSSAGQ